MTFEKINKMGKKGPGYLQNIKYLPDFKGEGENI